MKEQSNTIVTTGFGSYLNSDRRTPFHCRPVQAYLRVTTGFYFVMLFPQLIDIHLKINTKNQNSLSDY